MNAVRTALIGGLVALTTGGAAHAQSMGPAGNCHFNTIRGVAPGTPITTYRPGYASDREVINRLRLDLARGIPLSGVDVSRLRTPHVIGVRNGTGFVHTAWAVPTPTGVHINQRFDTSPHNYTPRMQAAGQFINQTVRFGGTTRQPFAGNPGRVQVYCPGGACPQHRR